MPDSSAGLWSLREWKHYCTDATCAFRERYPSGLQELLREASLLVFRELMRGQPCSLTPWWQIQDQRGETIGRQPLFKARKSSSGQNRCVGSSSSWKDILAVGGICAGDGCWDWMTLTVPGVQKTI